MKKIYFLVLLFSITRLFAQHQQETEIIELNHFSNITTQQTHDEKTKISEKSPWLAFFLSVIFPGLGQIYNGDYFKALLQAGIFAGGAFLASSICFDCGSTSDPAAGVGLGMLFGSYLWSIIDAPISASSYNNRTAGLNIYSTEENKYSVRFNRIPSHKMYSLSLLIEL